MEVLNGDIYRQFDIEHLTGDMIVARIEIATIVYFTFTNNSNYGVYIYNEYILKYEIYEFFYEVKS